MCVDAKCIVYIQNTLLNILQKLSCHISLTHFFYKNGDLALTTRNIISIMSISFNDTTLQTTLTISNFLTSNYTSNKVSYNTIFTSSDTRLKFSNHMAEK